MGASVATRALFSFFKNDFHLSKKVFVQKGICPKKHLSKKVFVQKSICPKSADTFSETATEKAGLTIRLNRII